MSIAYISQSKDRISHQWNSKLKKAVSINLDAGIHLSKKEEKKHQRSKDLEKCFYCAYSFYLSEGERKWMYLICEFIMHRICGEEIRECNKKRSCQTHVHDALSLIHSRGEEGFSCQHHFV